MRPDLQPIIFVLSAMAIGIAPGFLLRNNPAIVRFVGHAASWSVLCLLFLLGATLGANHALFAVIPVLGWHGVVIGFCCTLGSALATHTIMRLFIRKDELVRAVSVSSETIHARQSALHSAIQSSLRILCAFIVGVLLARVGWLPTVLHSGVLTDYAIIMLMFLVGMGLGFDLRAFGVLRELHYKVLIVPMVIVAGTAVGSCGAAALLPEVSLRESLAVGAGFGYYSLSSIIITGLGDTALGSTALLANIFRELFTLITAPFLVRYITPLAPLAAAGATAMDTCLPVIVASAGERYGIIAVFSGIILTLLVPFLVSGALVWL